METRNLLEQLLAWAVAANTRLEYEGPPKGDGFMFGGNPEANPLFRRVRTHLDLTAEDDRETVAEGDKWMYKPPGVADR